VIVLASPAASQVVPGILGFLVVAGMGLALFFLLWSMNKHLRKVVREPKWREEARQAQQDDGRARQDDGQARQGDRQARQGDGQARQDEPEQDYTHNGTSQA